MRPHWWRKCPSACAVQRRDRDGRTSGCDRLRRDRPASDLHGAIADTLREAGMDGTVVPSLVEKDAGGDPLIMVLARTVVLGCQMDTPALFGAPPVRPRPADRLTLATQDLPATADHRSDGICAATRLGIR